VRRLQQQQPHHHQERTLEEPTPSSRGYRATHRLDRIGWIRSVGSDRLAPAWPRITSELIREATDADAVTRAHHDDRGEAPQSTHRRSRPRNPSPELRPRQPSPEPRPGTLDLKTETVVSSAAIRIVRASERLPKALKLKL
jgi:hypothetical protein